MLQLNWKSLSIPGGIQSIHCNQWIPVVDLQWGNTNSHPEWSCGCPSLCHPKSSEAPRSVGCSLLKPFGLATPCYAMLYAAGFATLYAWQSVEVKNGESALHLETIEVSRSTRLSMSDQLRKDIWSSAPKYASDGPVLLVWRSLLDLWRRRRLQLSLSPVKGTGSAGWLHTELYHLKCSHDLRLCAAHDRSLAGLWSWKISTHLCFSLHRHRPGQNQTPWIIWVRFLDTFAKFWEHAELFVVIFKPTNLV